MIKFNRATESYDTLGKECLDVLKQWPVAKALREFGSSGTPHGRFFGEGEQSEGAERRAVAHPCRRSFPKGHWRTKRTPPSAVVQQRTVLASR